MNFVRVATATILLLIFMYYSSKNVIDIYGKADATKNKKIVNLTQEKK